MMREGPDGTLPTRFRSILEAKAIVRTGLAEGDNWHAILRRELPKQLSKAGVIFYLSRQAGSQAGRAGA